MGSSVVQLDCLALTKQRRYCSSTYLVGALGLPVGLRVERGRQLGLGAGQLEQSTPEPRGKLRAAVRHNVVGEAVQLDDVVEHERGRRAGRLGLGARDEVRHLGEAAHDHEHGADAADVRQVGDKVGGQGPQGRSGTGMGWRRPKGRC
jgi:hypothetical protein